MHAELTRATRITAAAFAVMAVPWYGPPLMAVVASHGWIQALVGTAAVAGLWLWFTRPLVVALPPSREVRDEADRRGGR